MSTLILYDKPTCPFCWKVRLALHELGLAFEQVDSQSPQTRARWQTLTPQKTVPVLQHAEVVIYESTVIQEYLHDISQALLPADPAQRARARLLNNYSDSTLGAGLREVIFEKRDKRPEHWDWQRIDAGTARFEQALAYLEQQLGNQPFFTDRYSLPECALTARFGLASAYGVSIPDAYVNLRAWFTRMQDRPSYQASAPQIISQDT